MSELEKAERQLQEILDKIPVSGSFESARLAKRASILADKITVLCSHPDAPVFHENQSTSDTAKEPAKD